MYVNGDLQYLLLLLGDWLILSHRVNITVCDKTTQFYQYYHSAVGAVNQL